MSKAISYYFNLNLPKIVNKFCISRNGLKSLIPRFVIKITHNSRDPESARVRT